MTCELGSPEWLDRLRAVVLTAAADADLAGVRYTACEVLTNAPAHLAPDGTIAWHFTIRDGSVRFGVGRPTEAERTLSVDYALARDLMKASHGVSDPEGKRRTESGLAAGLIQVEGGPSLVAVIPQLSAVHGEIAGFTA